MSQFGERLGDGGGIVAAYRVIMMLALGLANYFAITANGDLARLHERVAHQGLRLDRIERTLEQFEERMRRVELENSRMPRLRGDGDPWGGYRQ